MSAPSTLLQNFLNQSFATVGCFTIEEDNAMSLENALSHSAPNMQFYGKTKETRRNERRRRVTGRIQRRERSASPNINFSRWESLPSMPLSPEKNIVATFTESTPCRLSPPRIPMRVGSAEDTPFQCHKKEPPRKPMRQGTVERLLPNAPSCLDDDGEEKSS